MPQLESQQFYKQIENVVDKPVEEQQYSPLYFFFGEEPYLIQQALHYVKACTLANIPADFNYIQFYSSDTDMSRVRDEVETLPMMSPRRVVVLREVQDLTDSEWSQLEPILSEPVTSTTFILCGGKIDKRKKFFKLLQEQAVTVEFKKPYDNQIPGWIRHLSRAFELEISDEAVQLLHRLVGHQLMEIESEIRKLSQFLGIRKKIEIEDVAQVVSSRKEESVFELADSIADNNRSQALMQLASLLEQGQNEIGIVQMIARHFRILLLIKEGLEQGLSGQKLASLAQVPGYFLNDYMKQAKAWSFKRLEQGLLILGDTDKALKSSPLSSHIWLENMIIKIGISKPASQPEMQAHR